ncbi:MAG: hypothetical protein EAZ53_04005 [Bacteroidetes bacterium]|nr:MAG: hypothetical protein EAZ53_04005 [Bacteroidota bacterium]
MRCINYGNLYIAGSGTKTISNYSLNIVTVANDLNVASGSTFQIFGSATAKDFLVSGVANINGIVNFGSGNGNSVSVVGAFLGNGSVNMGLATSYLTLRGATNPFAGTLSSSATSIVIYDRVGDQTVFGSNDYPLLNISGGGVKTITGTLICTAFSLQNSTVQLGAMATASGTNWSFWNQGTTALTSGEFQFLTPAKRVFLQGNVNGAANINMTSGNTIAHYLKFGGNGNSITPTQILPTATTGCLNTIEYSGPSTQPVLNRDYCKLIISELGVKSMTGSGLTYVYNDMVIGSNATFDAGDLQTFRTANLTVGGTFQDVTGVLSDEIYLLGGNVHILPTGRMIGNGQTRFWFANNVLNQGIISISGAGSYDQMGGGVRTFNNQGTVSFNREVRVDNNFTLIGNPFYFGDNVTINGASNSLTISTTGINTIVGILNGATALNGFVHLANSHTRCMSSIPMATGRFNVSATGNTFEYAGSLVNHTINSSAVYANLLISGGVRKVAQSSFRVLENCSIVGTNTDFLLGIIPSSVAVDIGSDLVIGNSSRLTFSPNATVIMNLRGELLGNSTNSTISFAGINPHNLYVYGQNNSLQSMMGTASNTVSSVHFVSNDYSQNIPRVNYPNLVLSSTGVTNTKIFSTGVTNPVISGNLTMFNTVFDIANTDVTLSNNASTVIGIGGFGIANMIKTSGTGNLIKRYATAISGAQEFLFPIGLTGYSPLVMRTTGTTSFAAGSVILASVKRSIAPNLRDGTYALNRYWNTSSIGLSAINATLTGSYVDADLRGIETSYVGGWWNNTSWQIQQPINSVANTVSATFTSATALNGNLTAAYPAAFNSSISLGNIATPSFCQGQVVTVPAQSFGTAFVGGNQFIIEVSTTVGFTSFIYSLGTISATSIGASGISTIIPTTLPASNFYRLRIRATNPFYISSLAGYVLTVNGSPSFISSVNTSICRDGVSTISLTPTGGTSWIVVPSNLGTFVGDVFTPTLFEGNATTTGTIFRAVTGGCTSPGLSLAFKDIPNNATLGSLLCTSQTLNLITSATGGVWTTTSTPVLNFGSIASNVYTPGVGNTVNVNVSVSYIKAGCKSAEIISTVFPNTTITSQPVGDVEGIGGNPIFSVVAAGKGLTYAWQEGTPFVFLSPNATYTGTNTNTLSISNVPLSLNNKQYRVVITGACGPNITSTGAVLTVINVSAAMYRSVNSGNWTTAGIWQVSNNGGISWGTTINTPGTLVPQDLVSITGGTNVQITGALVNKLLHSLTISGNLQHNGVDSLRIAGATNVMATGTLNGLNTFSSIVFNGPLINRGEVMSSSNSLFVFRNGIVNNGINPSTGSMVLNGNNTFGLNNQTISGTAAFVLFVNGLVSINSGIEVTQTISPVQITGNLNGGGANSKYILGSNKQLFYAGNAAPMNTGQLVANATGSNVYYASSSGTQIMKATNYYDLTFNNNAIKEFTGNINVVNDFTAVNSTNGALRFSSISGSMLSVAGITNLPGMTSIDMSFGNQPHQLILSGPVTNISGTFTKGSGTVIYNGTMAQNVMPFNYNNLIIDKASTKTQVGSISVTGFTVTGGATLNASSNQITGNTVTGSMLLDANTTLILGNTTSGANITMPGFNSLNTMVDLTSTIIFQSNTNQSAQILNAPFGNLILRGGGIKTGGFSNVNGNLTVENNTDYRTSNINFSGKLLTNNGLLSYTAPTANFYFIGDGFAAQTIAGTAISNFANIFVDINTNIDLKQSISVTGTLGFNDDGNYILNNNNIILSGNNATIVGANANRCISSNGLISGGAVVLQKGNIATDYDKVILPFALNSDADFVQYRISNIGGGTTNSISLKPLATTIGTNYNKYGFWADRNGTGGATSFTVGVSVPGTSWVGNPTNILANGVLQPTGVVNQPNNTYSSNQINPTFPSTYFAAGNTPVAKKYRSISSGAWNFTGRWEQSSDGTNWIPATTSPGMSIAGDEVEINNFVIIDNAIPYSISTVGINAGATMRCGAVTARNLTVTGNFTCAGTLDMTTGFPHNLYLGGLNNSMSGTLSASAGSTIHYNANTAQTVFVSNGYENLNISGLGEKTINADFRVNNLVVAQNATFTGLSNGNQSAQISGTSDISGTLKFKTQAGGDGWNIAFREVVQTYPTGKLVLDNAGDGIGLDFQGDFINNGQYVDITSSADNYITFSNTNPKSVVANQPINFGTATVDVTTDTEFSGTSSFTISNTFTVSSGSTLTNQSTINATTLIGLGNFVNATNATFIYKGATIPLTYLDFSASNNLAVFNNTNNSQTIPAINFYNLSVVGVGSNGMTLEAGVINVDGNLYNETQAVQPLGILSSNTTLKIRGDIVGSGVLAVANAITNTVIEVRGNYSGSNNFSVGNTSDNQFIYAGSGNQIVNASNYATLEVKNGGDKTVNSAIDIYKALSLSGANLVLNGSTTLNLFNGSVNIGGSVPFGFGNAVVASTSANALIKNGSVISDFINFVFPLSTPTVYTPLTVTSFNYPVGNQFLSYAVTDYTSAYLDYIKHQYFINPSSVFNNFNFTIEVTPSSSVGNEGNLHLFDGVGLNDLGLVSNPIANKLSHTILLNMGASPFTFNSTTNKLYRSVTSTPFNWTASNTNWEESADNGGTWSPAAQTPGATGGEIYSVIISPTHTVTNRYTNAAPQNLSISGGALLDLANNAFSVAGQTFVDGELRAGGTAGENIILGKTSIGSLGKIQGGTDNAFNITDYLVNDGLFFNPSNDVELNALSEFTISGIGQNIFNGVRLMNGTANVLNQAQALTVTGALTDDGGSGIVWKNDDNSSFTYKGSGTLWSGTGIFDATSTGNTFEYALNGNQTIQPITYFNLAVSGTGTKSITANTTALGDVLGAGTLAVGNNITLFLAGNFDHTGTLTPAVGSIIDYFGSNTQNVKPTTYANMRVRGGGDKILIGNVTIGDGTNSSSLNMAGAKVVLGDNNLIINNASGIAEITPYSTANYVETNGLGSLGRKGPGAIIPLYPIGSNGFLASVTGASFNIAPTNGTLFFRTEATEAPLQINSLSSLKRHWVSTCVGCTISSGTYTFKYDDADIQGLETNYKSAYKTSVANWVVGTPGVTPASNEISIVNPGATSVMLFTAGPIFLEALQLLVIGQTV